MSITKKPRGGKLSNRTIVKKHLKEWNFDEGESMDAVGASEFLPDEPEETLPDEGDDDSYVKQAEFKVLNPKTGRYKKYG